MIVTRNGVSLGSGATKLCYSHGSVYGLNSGTWYKWIDSTSSIINVGTINPAGCI